MFLTITHGWHTVPFLPEKGSCCMAEHRAGQASVPPRQPEVSQSIARGQMEP